MFALKTVPVDQQIHLFERGLFIPLHEIFHINYGVLIVSRASLKISYSLSQPKVFIFEVIDLLSKGLTGLVHIFEVQFIVLCLPIFALVDNMVILALGNRILTNIARRRIDAYMRTNSALGLFELDVLSPRVDDNWRGWLIGGDRPGAVGRKIVLKVIRASDCDLRAPVAGREGSVVGWKVRLLSICYRWTNNVPSLYDLGDIFSVVYFNSAYTGLLGRSHLAVINERLPVVLDIGVDEQPRKVVLLVGWVHCF